MSSSSAPGRHGGTGTGARRERDRLRRELAGRPVAEIAQAMRIHFGDRPRRAFREARGWSLQQVADRYNDIEGSGVAPMSKQRISEWELWPERGKRRFSVTGLAVLAAVFETSAQELLDQADRDRLPVKDLLALERLPAEAAARPAADGEPAAASTWTGPDAAPAVSRAAEAPGRWPTGPAGGPPAPRGRRSADWTELIAAAGDEASGFIRWAEGVNVGEHGIADLSERVALISREHMHSPPLPTFLRARAIADQAVALLREGRQRPTDALDLYLVAGQAYGLMAWIAGDLGQHGAAVTQARTSWMCAERAGHNGLRAWARAVQSKVAYWAGCVEESAGYAQEGLAYPCPDSAPVLLACLHARSLARLRRSAEALEALQAASRARDNTTAPDIGGLYGFTPANQYHMQASTLLWLADADAALRHAGRAIDVFEAGGPDERFHGPLMIARLDAAYAHLVRGEVEGALALSEPVLEISPELRLDAFDQRLAGIRELVGRPAMRASAPARELAERIDGYRAMTIAPEPRAITS